MCTSSTFDTESPINRQEATEPKIDYLILPSYCHGYRRTTFIKIKLFFIACFFLSACESKVRLAKSGEKILERNDVDDVPVLLLMQMEYVQMHRDLQIYLVRFSNCSVCTMVYNNRTLSCSRDCSICTTQMINIKYNQ